jgi:hypothetical protein
MRKIILFVLAMTVSTGLLAQKTINGPNAEVREVGVFHSIKISGGIHLLLTQAEEQAVAVSAAARDDRERIRTVVEDGVLKISFQVKGEQGRRGKVARKLRAYVSVKELRSLRAAGGALVEIDGELKANAISIAASSGAIVNGKINADNIEVDGSSGRKFCGFDLAVNNCYAETNSGAAVEVTVNKELTATATSGGAVRYKGDAMLRKLKTNSGGSVRKQKS